MTAATEHRHCWTAWTTEYVPIATSGNNGRHVFVRVCTLCGAREEVA